VATAAKVTFDQGLTVMDSGRRIAHLPKVSLVSSKRRGLKISADYSKQRNKRQAQYGSSACAGYLLKHPVAPQASSNPLPFMLTHRVLGWWAGC